MEGKDASMRLHEQQIHKLTHQQENIHNYL